MNNGLLSLCFLLDVVVPLLIIFSSAGSVVYGIKYKKIKQHKYSYEWVYSFVIGISFLWGLVFLFVLYDSFFPIPSWVCCENPKVLLIFVRPMVLLSVTSQYVLNKLKYLKTKRYRLYSIGGDKICQNRQSE